VMGRWFVTTLALMALGACTTDKIVFRNRPPFNPPADSLSGFLGYFDVGTKQTTCGNCHVLHQRDWKQTHHAGAWADLQASGHATSSCEPCHTVSQNGNLTVAPAGYSKAPDSAYQDVQCESCHGPGVSHVLQPDQPSTAPLAHISLADTTASCASCHTGTHNPFFDEWKQSRHAQIVTSAASNPDCASCHDGKQTLLAWGVNSAYAEKDQGGPEPVDCAVCHNPHGSPNEHQLRFSARNPDPAQNLCMQCHLRRIEPAGGSSYGTHPHAPQGAVVLGIAGYRPAGFAFDTTNTLVGSHGPGGNPNLCAACHVYRFTITDPATGAFQFQATGHLFRPLPCYDPTTGYPTADNGCAYDESVRSFKACAQSGCHVDEATAQGLLGLERQRIQQLVDVLWKDVNGNQSIDAFPTDSGYLPKIKLNAPGEFAADSVITAAEGAEFNARLTGEGLDGNGDKSKGVHNPFLYEALLRASINDLQRTYPGFLPAPPRSAQEIMDHPLGGGSPALAQRATGK
jgi:predicted CXXCH cytochrome family protein